MFMFMHTVWASSLAAQTMHMYTYTHPERKHVYMYTCMYHSNSPHCQPPFLPPPALTPTTNHIMAHTQPLPPRSHSYLHCDQSCLCLSLQLLCSYQLSLSLSLSLLYNSTCTLHSKLMNIYCHDYIY